MKHVIEADSITVKRSPEGQNPCANNFQFHHLFVFALTKIMVFSMALYSKILFIRDVALVILDLSSACSCGYFCAIFISSCYFIRVRATSTTCRSPLFTVHHLPIASKYDGGNVVCSQIIFKKTIQVKTTFPHHHMTALKSNSCEKL